MQPGQRVEHHRIAAAALARADERRARVRGSVEPLVEEPRQGAEGEAGVARRDALVGAFRGEHARERLEALLALGVAACRRANHRVRGREVEGAER
ncbi:MAG TPA: hypothetical protein VF904_01505, partial [Anaeromyxobacteraceae bacterium]